MYKKTQITIQGDSYYQNFYYNMPFEYNGIKYKIVDVDHEPGSLLYRLTLKRIDLPTRYSYDLIDFFQVVSIERISLTEIKMLLGNGTSIKLTFEDAEECLKEYLLLQQISSRERTYIYGQ